MSSNPLMLNVESSSSEGETLQKLELRVYTRRNLSQSNREQTTDLSQDHSNSPMNDPANPGNIHSPSHNSLVLLIIFLVLLLIIPYLVSLILIFQLPIGNVPASVPNVLLQTIFLITNCLTIIKPSHPK